MRTLSDRDFIALIRERWDARLQDVLREIKAPLETDIVSKGLKIKHKKSGILYTVVSVSSNDVILKTPEGEQFIVDGDDLEKNYVLS